MHFGGLYSLAAPKGEVLLNQLVTYGSLNMIPWSLQNKESNTTEYFQKAQLT